MIYCFLNPSKQGWRWKDSDYWQLCGSARLIKVIWSVHRTPFCLAAWGMSITRLSQNAKNCYSNFIFQGRVICSGIYILVKKNVASLLDLRFLFVAMHSWLHEHKQMWNHPLGNATLRKWNKFNTMSGNTILCHSLKERVMCFFVPESSQHKRPRIHLCAIHYLSSSEPSFINLRKLGVFTALYCPILIYSMTRCFFLNA